MPGLSSVITQVQRPPTSSPTNARRVKPVGDASDTDVPSVPEEEDLDDVVISVPPKPRAGLSVASGAEDERQETVVVETKPTGWRALLACLCGPSSETREISTKTSEENGGSNDTTVARQRVNTQGTAYAQSASAPDVQHSAPGFQIPVPPPYNGPSLLGPVHHADKGKKCLVLDLDETLVHSSFKPVSNADFIIPVEIEGDIHHVYVLKRPGVDQFLKQCAERYEIVVFTASLSKYADPLLDQLDVHRTVRSRLFREACVMHGGNFVKDLSRLGRDMRSVIIVDNAPHSYAFQPYNAIGCGTWFDDPTDTELFDLQNFLFQISDHHDVTNVLDSTKGRPY